jgi:transposase-like protein
LFGNWRLRCQEESLTLSHFIACHKTELKVMSASLNVIFMVRSLRSYRGVHIIEKEQYQKAIIFSSSFFKLQKVLTQQKPVLQIKTHFGLYIPEISKYYFNYLKKMYN